MGYPTFDSLENLVAKNPGVTLNSLTILYTNSVAAEVVVQSATIGCVNYTFDYVAVDDEDDEDGDDTNVLGATDPGTAGEVPAAAEMPKSLPLTGANEQLAALVTLGSMIATAGGVYAFRGRSADLPL